VAEPRRRPAERPQPAVVAPAAEPEPDWDDWVADDDAAQAPMPTRLTPEDEAIRLQIHRPAEVDGRLSSVLFADPVRREAFAAIEHEGVMAAADRVGDRAASLLRRLAVDPTDAETEDVIAGLVRNTADRVARDLQLDARHASTMEDRQGYATAIAWLKNQTEQLSERTSREAAIAQLLPWLIQHAEGREG